MQFLLKQNNLTFWWMSATRHMQYWNLHVSAAKKRKGENINTPQNLALANDYNYKCTSDDYQKKPGCFSNTP